MMDSPTMSPPACAFSPRAVAVRRLILLLAMLASAGLVATEPARPDFEKSIAPLLIRRCLECHNEREAAGGLVLTTRERLLAGGDTGPAVVPGKAAGSFLLQRVTKGEMPPEKKDRSQSLPPEEVELLRAWIAAGAHWPQGRILDLFERTTDVRGGRDWWSLRAVKRPAIPALKAGDEAVNPIDAFVLARLEAAGMEPAPLADRRTLIRRVYFDVIGLPPEAGEIDAFAAKDSPEAYENLVDRLLASPHFGERWARYWLDLVRFAETCGYERDQVKPGVWKYRDWVIDSINSDKPYDRFVTEQLAGDELSDRGEDAVIATGFLRVGTWNDEPNDPQEYKYERLEDMVHATSSAFLAMTVKCARCHDHKFDPIPQQDYYRLATAFWAGFIEPGSGKLLGGPDAKQLGYDVFGWTDRSRDPPPLNLLRKGNPHQPGAVVEPRHLSLVSFLDPKIAPAPAAAKTSHRRRQLAEWITRPTNPLTARVLVNRLWQHHFGQAIVRSPNNFGFTGDRPTHPGLLDWLAAELVRGRWKMKRLHKLMLMSRTYRQASVHPRESEYSERDFVNRLIWRANRRRLDAEALRDAMLAVSGELDLKTGGPSFRPSISPEALEGLSRKAGAWTASPLEEQNRRSVYIFSQRSLLVPLMTTFDFCDTTLPCGQRDVTTVAPQALALLNNAFVHRQSTALASQVAARARSDRGARVRAAWRLVLGRLPSSSEIEAALLHLDGQSRRFAARFENEAIPDEALDVLPVTTKLVLHLSADHGVTRDESGRVARWQDASSAGHHAAQDGAAARPVLLSDAINGRPAVRFDGNGRFLHVAGQVLTAQQFTVLAVVSDRGSGAHREILSDWDGDAGNSVTSVFLGTTGTTTVRFSDNFSGTGALPAPGEHFLLSAVADQHDAVIHLNGSEFARKGSALSTRTLDRPYVVGRQGSLNGEFWSGDIGELLVYDRALSQTERERATRYLMRRHGLTAPPRSPPDPEMLALASLCHVLLNANEFIYVD